MTPFSATAARPYAVLVGTAATLRVLGEFAVQRRADPAAQILILLQVRAADALRLRPSTVMVEGMPAPVIACVAELAALDIVSRLASEEGLPGCFEGTVDELLAHWLAAQSAATLQRIALYVAAPAALCESTQVLATRFQLNGEWRPATEP